MKKILLLSLLFFNQSILFSMEEGDVITDTQYLFDLSYSDYTPLCLERIIVKYKQDPTFNINYQNEHGTTIALNAATSNNWQFVDILLKHGADKNIKDNYQQSLFSKVLHATSCPNQFTQLLQKYTPEEINAECKSMPLHLDRQYRVAPPIGVNSVLALTLKGIDMDCDAQESSAFFDAFHGIHIPHIVHLLKHNKNLVCDKICTFHPGILFVLRETFNNGSCTSSLPVLLIYQVLFTQCSADYNLPSDVAQLIQQKYIRLLIQNLPEELLSTVEAFLWQPVCIQACQLMGINDTNEQQCLARILLMLQKKKTELNVKLLCAQEKHAQK